MERKKKDNMINPNKTLLPDTEQHNVSAVKLSSFKYLSLLKTKLRISHFKYFHWRAGHRLSVHIPAVPNMVRERVSNKGS